MANLYIICGHGNGDSGACGNGYQEAERVRALAARIKALGGSSVEVLDTSRNWYADAGINSLNLPKGAFLLELHMDSAAASAKGGHVIIYGGFEPDEYDKSLAEFISGYFPGRSVTISKRTDLANPRRAAQRGINYRLLECCFISNKSDLTKFNNNMDEVAKGILASFNIKAAVEVKKEEPKTEAKPKTATMYQVVTGSFSSKANANKRVKELKEKGFDSFIQVK